MPEQRVAIGSDHAGFGLKEAVKEQLAGLGYAVDDLGTHSTQSVDYPDFGRAVAEAVTGGTHAKGVLVCGTGIGMSITANKVPGARAALAWSEETARLAREHNDANVLVLGARVTPPEAVGGIVRAFLGTEFAGGRHAARVNKIMELDRERERNGSDEH
jgi:ribose 5-phosphate isomerase B